MNHLTNLYKHKCEQLQEQLNHLTRMLNEAPGGGVPPFRGKPRIKVDDIHSPQLHTTRPHSGIPGVPESWTDLLNLGNSNDPGRMHLLINHLSDTPGFTTWWEQNYGILKNVGDVYQRLIHGTVWRWDNTLKAWQPINKPGTPTHFGQMGPGGVLITPHIWDPTVINPLNSPKPPPRITPPQDPGPGMNPGWNSGTNN